MIRGPVLPQLREGLWTLVANHLDAIENGLALVLPELDCSDGQLGPIEGLARDASGAPVFVLLAVEGDALLAARALSALDFKDRVGDALTTAIPEGSFRAGAPGRVIVIGTGTASSGLDSLVRLGLAGLDLCRLEPFRIAGTERFAVRWLGNGGHSSGGHSNGDHSLAGAPAPLRAVSSGTGPEFQVEDAQKDHWESILRLCKRLDAGVGIDGDRFWRRITWQGRFLGQVVSSDGVLQAIDGDGTRRSLLTAADVRVFCDMLVRRYAVFAGLVSSTGRTMATAPTASVANVRDEVVAGGGRGAKPPAGDSLRSSMAQARLSPEEYSALGGLDRGLDRRTEATGVGDDVARIVAAQEGSWASPPKRSD